MGNTNLGNAEVDVAGSAKEQDGELEPVEFRATIQVDVNALDEEHAARIAWHLAGELSLASHVTNATVESVY